MDVQLRQRMDRNLAELLAHWAWKVERLLLHLAASAARDR
jgi:hypothetical protein